MAKFCHLMAIFCHLALLYLLMTKQLLSRDGGEGKPLRGFPTLCTMRSEHGVLESGNRDSEKSPPGMAETTRPSKNSWKHVKT
jgi:hypothetical protein